MYKKKETQRGITLIALVITIIVMLILVGVTISMAVNGGLFDYAGKAVGDTQNALDAEQDLSNGGVTIGGTYYNSIDEYLIASGNKTEPVETISKTTSYVGYYADFEGDGTIDGVIYADLAIGGSGAWGYSYSYEAIPAEELKDYYVSRTADGDFGNGVKVLTATGEGKDRFYVMALEDFTEAGNCYYWYYNSHNNAKTEIVTEDEFGTGKANTVMMIEKWNASAFGTPKEDATYKDIWGPIQNSEKYEIVETEGDSKKWFVPSAGEWAAFADALDVYCEWNDDDTTSFPSWLSGDYLTSSQVSADGIWYVGLEACDFVFACAWTQPVQLYARLSATF